MQPLIDFYMYVEIPHHEPFTIMIRHQTVVQAPVMHKWMIRKPWSVVKKWLSKPWRKAKMKVTMKQTYII